jgi:hypothetical protein
MARRLYEIGVDVPFLSILTPYRGTALHARLEGEGRLLTGRGWEFYNGYNVAFRPARMTPEELHAAHRALWREAFSVGYTVKRILRALFRLRIGAFLMCAMMNLFYCLKALRGNSPACFGADHRYDEFQHLPAQRVCDGTGVERVGLRHHIGRGRRAEAPAPAASSRRSTWAP